MHRVPRYRTGACPPMPVKWLLHCRDSMCQVDPKDDDRCRWPITGIASVSANRSRAVQTLCKAWQVASVVHNWRCSKRALRIVCREPDANSSVHG